ncbi:MAG: glycoside hydrolase family 99-like domain-containing protein [Lentisphaeria bacterium]
MKNRPVVCAYYFPNWHVDPRNEKLHGKGWTEWRVLQCARPRFTGHPQPKIPLWGYGDEADPSVMEQKIKTAAAHGIDAFIFDYYFFADGTYRERCLQEGFLKAKNCHDLKFAVMWANHRPIYAHPGNYRKPAEPLWDGDVTPETFYHCTEHLLATCLREENYLRVKGGLYFSVYNLSELIRTLGGTYITRLVFDDFRHRVEKAGLGKLFLDAMFNSTYGNLQQMEKINEIVRTVGLDSCSNYGNLHSGGFPCFDYGEMMELNLQEMLRISRGLSIPYNPVVMTGFDSSPRTVQSDMYENIGFPFKAISINNEPLRWEKYLCRTAEFLDSQDATAELLHLACWNEWTEGAYLEPDCQDGLARLEAVAKIFGVRKAENTKQR